MRERWGKEGRGRGRKRERERRESERRERGREGKRDGGGEGGGLSRAGVLSSGGRGCWETNESSRHLVHTGDCLSIQIAVFRPAWERAENFLRELITWQLSCLVQFTKGRGLIRAGFLFLSEEGALALHPLFQLWLLSPSLHLCCPPLIPPYPPSPRSLPPSTAPHFHSIGALKVIEMTAYRKRLIKLFIISLNQYVWIVKTSKSAPGKVIVNGRQQLLSRGWVPGSPAPFKATFTLT